MNADYIYNQEDGGNIIRRFGWQPVPSGEPKGLQVSSLSDSFQHQRPNHNFN